jgi:hypothetical protein
VPRPVGLITDGPVPDVGVIRGRGDGLGRLAGDGVELPGELPGIDDGDGDGRGETGLLLSSVAGRWLGFGLPSSLSSGSEPTRDPWSGDLVGLGDGRDVLSDWGRDDRSDDAGREDAAAGDGDGRDEETGEGD